MKKANQTNGTAIYDETALKQLLGYLDSSARKVMNYEENIRREKTRAQQLENRISMDQVDLEKAKLSLVTLEKEKEALPKDGLEIEGAKKLMDKIASLPWIEKVVLDSNIMHIFTRQGVLKTLFYNRVVMGNNNRAVELLPEVTELPLPQYEITLDIRNMGGSWAVNSALQIRLANPAEFNTFGAAPASWVHEPRSHWAANNIGDGWSTLCLGDYDRHLIDASKKGLLELLTELAIFLQRSGWSHAYINKTAWSVLLGNPLYNLHLTRMFEPGEDTDTITAQKRKRTPEFLKENNITSNMYEYGSNSSDDDERNCLDCDCEDDYDDDCGCDCH